MKCASNGWYRFKIVEHSLAALIFKDNDILKQPTRVLKNVWVVSHWFHAYVASQEEFGYQINYHGATLFSMDMPSSLCLQHKQQLA